MLVFILVYIFYPSANSNDPESQIEKVNIDFLDVDPQIADSIITELNETDLILQHVVWRIPADSNFDIKNLKGGGYLFNDKVENIRKQIQHFDSINPIRPYYLLEPNEKFLSADKNLNQKLLNANSSKVNKHYLKQIDLAIRTLHLNGIILPFSNPSFQLSVKALSDETPLLFEDYKTLIEKNRDLLAFVGFQLDSDQFIDSSYFKERLKEFTEIGLPLIISSEDSIKDNTDLRQLFKTQEFNGLIGIESKNFKNIDKLIQKGADFVILDFHPTIYNELMTNIRIQGIEKKNYSHSIKRNLLAKTWMRNGLQDVDTLAIEDSVTSLLNTKELLALNYEISAKSTVLINNELFPIGNLKKGFDVYAPSKNQSRFLRTIKAYSSYTPVRFIWENSKLLTQIASTKKKTIFLLDEIRLDTCSKELMKIIQDLANNKNVILINIGNSSNLPALNQSKNLIYISDFSEINQYLLAKQICGVTSFNGNLAFYHKALGKQSGNRIKRIRLGQGRPEEVGLNSDTLRKIDYLVRSAINGRAFPGCQVLVIKNGQIVYDKNFGHQTYARERSIKSHHVYDIASMTKIVATTMVAMKLYEMKAFNLSDSLYEYLPEDTLRDYLRRKSTIRNIRFDELLIHKSGLPSGAPIIQYLDYVDRQKEIGRYDRYYCDEKDDTIFCVEIANGYYLDGSYLDSMWIRMNSLYIDKSKSYRYSDVNMNLLYRMFKSIILKKELADQPRNDYYDVFSEFVRKNFYKPLEMKHTLYLPRQRMDTLQIVPTENDRWWRKQVVRGYVHDPNAALYGGIAGNAGIFSNTKDLAKLFQMLIDGGSYDGKKYLRKSTIELFTQQYDGSHRGLGFNKQTASKKEFGISPSAPVSLFGHTGFTGTCAWADPENEIIFIFLSNRVYPKVNKRIYKFGVRKNIHDFIYRAMFK